MQAVGDSLNLGFICSKLQEASWKAFSMPCPIPLPHLIPDQNSLLLCLCVSLLEPREHIPLPADLALLLVDGRLRGVERGGEGRISASDRKDSDAELYHMSTNTEQHTW